MSPHKPCILLRTLILLSVIFSNLAMPLGSAVAAPTGTALQFDGTTTNKQHVTFGAAPGLGVTIFTLEAWVNRSATGGVVMSTGALGFDGGTTGGVTRPNGIFPVVTKGMGEGETPANVNMNYFLGITVGGVIGADFEDKNGGVNHPIWGTTVVSTGQWHHIAVTYTGSCWAVYLDGNAETMNGTTCPNATPESSSIQHAGLAAGLNSTGVLGLGFFSGAIDEARIWNRALTQGEIQTNKFSELTSGTGLLARWGLNEGSGTAVNSSVGSFTGIVKSATTTMPVWVTGFSMPDTTAPDAPTGLTATPYSGGVSLSWTANIETDLAGYNIYRSATMGEPYTKINTSPISGTTYTDSPLTNGTPYYYVVRAVDTSTNESDNSNEVSATPLASLGAALKFDGINDYVTFGPNLNATNFTLEAWVKRDAGGATMTTGSLGLDGTAGRPLAYPVLTKGMGQGETPANINMNYFLGITSTGMVGADFEDNAGGVNHPAWGSSLVPIGGWHHIAATYNGSCWALYLDGAPETLNGSVTACPNATPEATSIQHAGLAAGIGSTGQLSTGFFAGTIDEARIWNVARTPAEIVATVNQEVTSGAGLIGRWGMNEGTGTTIDSSVGTFPGTLTNGPLWVPGAPFNIVPSTPPAPPTSLTSAANSGAAQIDLSWTDDSTNETSFKIERSTTGSGGPFSALATVVADTTTYADSRLDASTEYCYRVYAANAAGDSAYSNVASATTAPAKALDFGSSSAYVALGDNANIAQFTLEAWIRRDGTGAAISTGSGGETMVPVITNGTAEAENAGADVNYFFGIHGTDGVLCLDFEEGQTGVSPSQNHPACGTTALTTGIWYHIAATYDGATTRLYLNGNLDRELPINQPANAVNTSQLAFGTSMTTADVASGFFDGALDEVRIWSVARSLTEIRQAINSQITGAQTNLVGRWDLEEGTGTTVSSTAGATIDGTITGSGWSWISVGAPFNINFPPEVTNPGTQTNIEGDGVSLAVVATGPNLDTLAYSATGLPEGLSIDASTGLIAGTISYHAAANSPYSVVVTVNDSHGGSTPVSFAWTVDQAPSGLCENDPTLVSCWPMEEGSGTVVIDATTYGNDGNTTGGPTWVAGKVGSYALNLNGAGQYAIVPDSNSLDIGSNNITLAAWVKPTKASAATQNIIKKAIGTTSLNGYELSLSSAGKVFVRFNGSASYRVDSTTSYPLDGTAWMHIAATYDGTTIRLYVNGVEENPKAASITIGANATNLGIGAEPATTVINMFQGLIDDARVYNRALTLEEIQTLTRRTLSVSKTGTGSGTVTSDPAGIACGATCSYAFIKDTIVTLSAAATVGSTFTGWSGAGCSGSGTCVVTMDAAKSVTANFADVTPPVLTITGATADGVDMTGTLAGGYVLPTTNDPAVDHLIQFKPDTAADEELANAYFGLYLTASTVNAAALKAYYDARGVPEPFLTYLKAAADGTNPFVYIKGSTVTLVDAAKHDILETDVAMTVPDDFPLGAYTVQGVIRDPAGNETTVTLKLIVAGDRVAPTLDITGATADGTAMAGNLADGYVLETTNDPAVDHLIQCAAGTQASETLADAYFGLYLTASTVMPAELQAYYAARGVPEPFLTYLNDAAAGTNPFVYIKGSTVTLVDAAKHDILETDVAMTVPDDFPLGAYTVQGVIRDPAGNGTTVTLKLIVAGGTPAEPARPAVSITKVGDDVRLSWLKVTADVNDRFTVVTGYQVFRSTLPFFTPDPGPGTGNLVAAGLDLFYLDESVAGSAGSYFCIVRAVNGIGPSANSKRVGVFTYAIVPGQD